MGRFKNILADDYIPEIRPGLLSIIIIWSAALIPLCFVLGALFLVVIPEFQEYIEPPRGCRRLGQPNDKKSNLADELNAKHTGTSKDGKDGSWKIKGIFVYPIKSCKAVELDESDVVSTGLKYDRQFCFAQLESPFPLKESSSMKEKTDHQWKFITQRQFPLMAQVTCEVWYPDPSRKGYNPNYQDVKNEGGILVRFPWRRPGIRGFLQMLAARMAGGQPEMQFILPFNPTEDLIKRDYQLEPCTIWKESPVALNMGIHIPPHFKYFLGVKNPLTVFRIHKEREVFRNAPRKSELGYQPVVGFADAYPIHILSVASIQALSKTLDPPIPKFSALRFRPNVVVSGCPAYSEDHWKRITIGDAQYEIVCRCVRCKMPNVDQNTGDRHKIEPDRTLRATRLIDEGAPQGTGCLGMNMVPKVAKGVIKVGDVVKLVESGEHKYMPL